MFCGLEIGCGVLWLFFGEEGVKSGEDEQRQWCGAEQAADDDHGEGALCFGSDAVGQGHGKKTEHGQQCGHDDGAEACRCAKKDCLNGMTSFFDEGVEMADHDHAVQDCLAKECDESDGCADAEGDATDPEGDDAADDGKRDV